MTGSRSKKERTVALSPSDVARLAELARIDLTPADMERLAPQLDTILAAVASVSEVAGEDVPPTSHALGLVNVFRADEVRPSLPAEAMKLAPKLGDGLADADHRPRSAGQCVDRAGNHAGAARAVEL